MHKEDKFIEVDNGKWVVFGSQSGIRYGTWNNPNDACEHLKKIIQKDLTQQINVL